MPGRIRVGVFGLGRRWPRYQAALDSMPSLLEVRAVADPSMRRATNEARKMQCDAAEGLEDLVDRADVDAVLLLTRSWYGLWPLERIARAGKPALCATSLADDHRLSQPIFPREPSPLILPVLAGGPAPAVVRLRGLLARRLGPARVVQFAGTVGHAATAERLLASGLLLHALCLCRELLPGPPETIRAAGPAGTQVVNLTLAYSDGRAALVSLTSGNSATARITVTAGNGTAVASLPRRLHWKDARGVHSSCLPHQPGIAAILGRFAEAIQSGRSTEPGVHDTWHVRDWIRAARLSLQEDRCVRLADA